MTFLSWLVKKPSERIDMAEHSTSVWLQTACWLCRIISMIRVLLASAVYFAMPQCPSLCFNSVTATYWDTVSPWGCSHSKCSGILVKISPVCKGLILYNSAKTETAESYWREQPYVNASASHTTHKSQFRVCDIGQCLWGNKARGR